MRKILSALFLLGAPFMLTLATWESSAGENARPFVTFRMQELDEKLEVGYAVVCVDVNGDGKKDIVVVDTKRVIWFENPTWKVHTIINGLTKPDNVCIDAYDIDGDGKIDFALGADWKPFNTTSGGTLQWLKRGKTLDEPWTVFPIGGEPTIHRIRFADIDGKGKKDLISIPLMGRGATAKNNWTDGAPVDIVAYRIPKDPTKDEWVADGLIDSKLHVAHNFQPVPSGQGTSENLLVASYEGVNLVSIIDGRWRATKIGTGNQDNPKGSRGASEIKQGKFKNGNKFIATIEPWHGNQVVVYTESKADDGKGLWDRHVIDEQLRWGHGVACVDLDGDGNDELIIGVRDDPDPKKGDKFTERRGVRIYKAMNESGTKWQRQIIDNGGIAVEDLTAVDLNGDGKIAIVAVGRATHNVRIYWNETKK